VPEISYFYGIHIVMRTREHRHPHFHVRYGDDHATVGIRAPRRIEGTMRPRVRRMVLAWAVLHEAALLANWDRVERGEVPLPIPPLE
jgi:hypothetical protein